jgi:hypothetical protein
MPPRRANGFVGDLPASLPQRQQFFYDPGPALTAPSFFHSLPHELSQHRTFVLAAKCLIERVLHIGRHTKVHRGHSETPIVEYFNNRMPANAPAVKPERRLH